MDIREITNKYEWEDFLQNCQEKTFLHSWNWGQFNETQGHKIWRFGVYNRETLFAVVMAIKITARRGTFLFIPHGPVTIDGTTADRQEILKLFLLNIQDTIKEEKISFLRVAPVWQRTQQNESVFEDSKFRLSPIHMHPEVTWELDISLSEDEILAGMRKTTRYLIKQALKNADITIERSVNPDDLRYFWPVYKETAERHHFVVFSEKYLRSEFEIFAKDNQIELFLGKYKGEVVSAALFVFWQGTCVYHHSGSLSKFNKIPVSYLLQWEAIRTAKARGCVAYNFWGVSPDTKTPEDAASSKHPWAGLSLFKMGFGGSLKEYVKTQDLPISSKYWLNYIIEVLRKKKRNL
jgi:lipid II:glycine glycyltransferase (peptidoglycan interpeptide bridge formation enzyme)